MNLVYEQLRRSRGPFYFSWGFSNGDIPGTGREALTDSAKGWPPQYNVMDLVMDLVKPLVQERAGLMRDRYWFFRTQRAGNEAREEIREKIEKAFNRIFRAYGINWNGELCSIVADSDYVPAPLIR